MIGRTPEYLGKKIEGNEVKMTMLALLCAPAFILIIAAVAAALPAGVAGPSNSGPHGFSEMLYAYTSGAATNGSAFAGLSANTPFYHLTLAAAMFAGRFLVIDDDRADEKPDELQSMGRQRPGRARHDRLCREQAGDASAG
jgi:K+-transporting ATPase ATPase A chain